MSFAYLMESFPDPTKTFVHREVSAMMALGMAPVVFSVREPSAEERSLMEGAQIPARYFPPEPELRELIERERGSFSSRQRNALSHWRSQKGDSTRVFEALWLGRDLKKAGIRHVHAHFAGLAARTAWLARELWGVGYSFTGHADDIFSPEQKPISLGMLVRDARFIATETDYSRARVEEQFAGARGKTFRVFNGISVDQPPAPRDESIPPRIVSVGRLVEKKGFPTLLAACALLRDRGIEFGCDIAGSGPLDGMLRQKIAELQLGGHVLLHGLQPQSGVHALLQKARVFALAAQREGDGGSDNLPTVIMEAMLAGLPVVSTRIAGIPEMMDDGGTGLLTDENNPAALADALARLLCDEAFAQRLGAAGRKRACEKFSVTRAATELARLLISRASVTPPPAAVAANPSLKPPRFSRLKRALGL